MTENLDTKQLEPYLFGSEDLSLTPDSLIPGTETCLYIKLLQSIQKDPNSQETSNAFAEFERHYSSSSLLHKLQIRKNLLAYDKVTDSVEKKEILSKISNVVFGRDIVRSLELEASKEEKHQAKIISNSDFSTLDPKEFDIQDLINNSKNSLDSFKKLERYTYYKLSPKDVNNQVLLHMIIEGHSYDFGSDEIARLNDIYKQKDTYENNILINNLKVIFSKLTSDHLQTWLNINTDVQNNIIFVEHYIENNFSSQIEYEIQLLDLPREKITEEKLKKRLFGLKEIWEYAKNLPKIYYYFQRNLLLEVLKTAFALQAPDLILFLYYLSNFHLEPSEISKGQLAHLEFYQHDSITGIPQNKVIEYYLIWALKDSSNFNTFKNYFEHTYLEQTFAKSKLYFDSDSSNNKKYTSVLGAGLSEIIKEKTKLRIVSMKNEADQKPTYRILHKNIEEITINIYEIGLQSYFLKNHRTFDPDTILSGIFPSITKSISLNNSDPFKIQFADVHLDELQTKNGLFVIEMLSKNHKIRHIIKRGILYYVHRHTAAGNLILVFNSDLKLCKNACVYYENKKYDANSKGQIYFPYPVRFTDNLSILLSAEGIDEIVQVKPKKEDYNLECEFYCDKHSLVAGNEAKIILAPRLTINEFPTALGVLKAVRVSASVINENDVNSSLEEKDYDLTQKDYIQWSFRVPPKLKFLDISLKGKVWSTSGNKWVDLWVNKRYEIRNVKEMNNKIVIADLEMITSAEGYILKVIGKNGEHHSDVDVDVQLKHIYLREPINLLFRTNKAGEINLGLLEGIDNVSANIIEKLQMAGSNKRTWDLNTDFHGCVGELGGLEGEIIRAFYCKGAPENYRVLQWNQSNNCLSKVHNNCINARGDLSLEIMNLPAGNYLLVDVTRDFSVKITIVKGRRVPEYGFVLCENSGKIYENPYRLQSISVISTITLEESMKIDLMNWDEHTKVHLLAMPFYSSYDVYSDVLETFRKASLMTSFRAIVEDIQPDSDYSWLYNGDTDEVTKYVAERRKKNRILGNIFDKPTQILNPENTENQIMPIGEIVYAEKISREEISNSGIVIRSNVKEYKGVEWQNYKRNQRLTSFKNVKQVDNLFLRDFVKNPTKIIENMIPGADGSITIQKQRLSFEKYAGYWIVVTGKGCYSAQYVPNRDYEMEINDLALNNLMDPTKYYKEITQEEAKLKGEKVTITDISNAEIQLVDTLEKFFKCQKEILNSFSKHANFSLVELTDGYNSFEFLSKWEGLTLDQKQAYYDKYASHEINFFIYMKDKDYFNNFIRPFIHDKIEKTLVDEFLLGYDLSKYAEPQRIDYYNSFEISLIIWSLVNTNKKDEAQVIFDRLKMKEGTLRKYTQLEEEKIFEIIISLKSLDKTLSLENQIKDQLKEVKDGKDIEQLSKVYGLTGGSFMHSLHRPGRVMGGKTRALDAGIRKEMNFRGGVDQDRDLDRIIEECKDTQAIANTIGVELERQCALIKSLDDRCDVVEKKKKSAGFSFSSLIPTIGGMGF